MAAQTTKNAAAAKTASAPAAAKPGDPAPAAKKEKVKREWFPGLSPVDGKPTTKLKDFPPVGEGEGQFNPKLHKPLRRQDFENEAPFLEQQAAKLEQKAKELRQQAEEARTLGSQADRAKMKKLREMGEKMKKMREDFIKQGIDVDAMFKQMGLTGEDAVA